MMKRFPPDFNNKHLVPTFIDPRREKIKISKIQDGDGRYLEFPKM